MKDLKLSLFALFCVSFTAHAIAHSSESHEDKYIHPCEYRFYKYRLDDEPAEYAVSGGYNTEGKKFYMGFCNEVFIFNIGPITTNPPGVLSFSGGKGVLVNDTSRIFYMYNDPNHKYHWVDSKDGEEVPFAVNIGKMATNISAYAARVKINNASFVGSTPLPFKVIYYVDTNNIVKTSSKYQVLTCKSKKCKEPKTKIPMTVLASPLPDVGCINKWAEYKGDDAPAVDGISAGDYDCGNKAYVGMAVVNELPVGGRIQTIRNKGFYAIDANTALYLQNGSKYLVDNPKYTYDWVNFDGNLPNNAVFIRTPSSGIAFYIARNKINGHVEVSKYFATFGAATFAKGAGSANYNNFEVLVCDPWPKYQCGQEWKKYNLDSAPSTDGFSVGVYREDIVSYIGRGTTKCINGCDYEIGRVQTSPSINAGVYYLDELPAVEKFDNITAEYLVKNPDYTYKWIPSRSGVQVENALELHKEGHLPFYIGYTTINDNVFVGKVKPGEGLFFVNLDGNQETTSSYNVLTCTQPDASFGVYKEEDNLSWYSSFGCPVTKTWSFTQWRCVCREEFKNSFAVGTWNESTCSYTA